MIQHEYVDAVARPFLMDVIYCWSKDFISRRVRFLPTEITHDLCPVNDSSSPLANEVQSIPEAINVELREELNHFEEVFLQNLSVAVPSSHEENNETECKDVLTDSPKDFRLDSMDARIHMVVSKVGLEFQSISVSETQNLGFDDTFGNTTVVNDDNHISKPPSAIHHLHGEPLSIRDSLTREPAHSHISIDSQQVAMGQGSRINEDCVNESTSSEIEHSSKHKELCLHRFDRFPVNKGAVPFAL
ncbi:hypothetical protein Tco_1434899, partial [Tanacetum coccineum]